MNLTERIQPFFLSLVLLVTIGFLSNVHAQDWQEYYVLNQSNTLSWQYSVGHFPHTFLQSPDPAIGDASMELVGNQLLIDFVPVEGAVGVAEFIVEYWPDAFPPHPANLAFRVFVVDSYVSCEKDYQSVEVNSTGNTILPLDNDLAVGAAPLSITHLPIVRNGTATIAPDGQSLSFTPSPDHEGMAYLTYVACDTLGSCDKAEVTICVLPAGPPALSDTIYLSTSNRAAVAVFLPADGYVIDVPPSHGVLNPVSDDAWEYEPEEAYTGLDEFKLVKDSTYHRTVIVDIFYKPPPNTFANSDRFFTRTDEALTFDVQANDLKEYPIASYTEPTNGILAHDSAGVFTYTPDSSFTGAVAFEYTSCFLTHCETADVIIFVGDLIPENAETYQLVTQQDVPLVINYEIPLDGYAFTINALPSQGTLDLHAGSTTVDVLCASITGFDLLVYEPPAGYIGTDAFEIFYCIDGADCHLVKVDVDIQPAVSAGPCPCVDRCVWPGDADGSGQVDMFDVLALGWHIGSVGTPRNYPDNTQWMGQHSDDWNTVQIAADVDVKYADSDGDGLVSEADLQSIQDHYLYRHTLVPEVPGLKADYTFDIIPVTTELDSGDLAVFEISIGNSAIPVVDMHGMQFSLNLPPELVDSSSLNVFFDHESWLGHDAPAVEMQIQPWHGRIDAAFSRGTGVTATGHGVISVMTFIVVDDIEGIRPPGTRVPLHIGVNHVSGVNGAGHPQEIEGQGATVYLNLGGEEELKSLDDQLFIYPNPASNDYVNIHLNGKRAIQRVEVFNLMGHLVDSYLAVDDKHLKLDVANLPDGMYYARVIATDGVTGKKFEVLRAN